MKFSKLFLKTLLFYPIARMFSYILFNPISNFGKEEAIKLIIETIIFALLFSGTMWYITNHKKTEIK